VPSAKTWYIKPDGTGDAATIQAGIDSAVAGDTVLLAAGTYTGVGNRDIEFRGMAITVTSESGSIVTIIDCESLGRGFYFNGEGPASILSGVTIQNGSADGGGGIYCYNSSPTITDNTITGNSAASVGGGICIDDYTSSPTITNNIITGNTAGSHGGGICCRYDSYPTITHNTLSENSAPVGGGIYCSYFSNPTIKNTIIVFSSQGEGICCEEGGYPNITCCDLYGNAGGDALCGQDLGGNFSADPEFCGVSGVDNLYLQSDSPCAPGNHPGAASCGLIGALPVMCGSVMTEQKTWGEIKAIYHK
jgi:parallel beta-helix repeat protein